MGKISEALKKAGKSDRSKLVVRQETVVAHSSAIHAPDHHPAPERPPRIPSPHRDTQSKPPSAATVAEREERAQNLTAEANLEPVAAPVEQASPPFALKKELDAGDSIRTHPAAPHENPNVRMVRTPKPNQAVSSMPSAWMVAPEAGHHGPAPAVQPTGRRPIQVSYSETRVQAIDPERLRNNRIFSIFDDIETTNQVKILRTQVLKKLEAINGNSILVTSANPYEGKTFTSINLGVSIAKEFSRTVLIIDADLRKPTKRHTAFSTDFFSIDVDVGLTDYLKGEADIRDILINPGIERLTLIPGGRPVDNAPELLNSSRMAEMMVEVKSRYGPERLVILDGPALLPFPDAMILARYVDGVVPVVELEKTPTDQLKRMMDRLKEFLILGTVLNKNRG